jgi:large conductance mechanosensitive channel
MKFLKGFKEFAMKGNIVDLAVAVIIGATFGAIITSLVEDIITPLILAPALKASRVPDIDKLVWGSVKYGKFLSSIINFIIIALTLFMVINVMNKMKKAEPVATPEPSSTDQLLMEIRDALTNAK